MCVILLSTCRVRKHQKNDLYDLLPSRPFSFHSHPSCLGLFKRFVCLFGDCALVNNMLGGQHLLYCNPRPIDFAINIAQFMVPTPIIQHTILVMAISYKGRLVSKTCARLRKMETMEQERPREVVLRRIQIWTKGGFRSNSG